MTTAVANCAFPWRVIARALTSGGFGDGRSPVRRPPAFAATRWSPLWNQQVIGSIPIPGSREIAGRTACEARRLAGHHPRLRRAHRTGRSAGL